MRAFFFSSLGGRNSAGLAEPCIKNCWSRPSIPGIDLQLGVNEVSGAPSPGVVPPGTLPFAAASPDAEASGAGACVSAAAGFFAGCSRGWPPAVLSSSEDEPEEEDVIVLFQFVHITDSHE